MTPTLAGFIAWVRSVMGISVTVLPDSSVYFTYAFDVSMMIVNQQLSMISYTPAGSTATVSLYTLAVYNLGGSNLLQWAQDASGATIYKDGLPYFAYMRQLYSMNSFTPGIIQSSADERTNAVLVIPESLENLSIADLQYLTNPYGRQYLAFAQRAGTLWGIT